MNHNDRTPHDYADQEPLTPAEEEALRRIKLIAYTLGRAFLPSPAWPW